MQSGLSIHHDQKSLTLAHGLLLHAFGFTKRVSTRSTSEHSEPTITPDQIELCFLFGELMEALSSGKPATVITRETYAQSMLAQAFPEIVSTANTQPSTKLDDLLSYAKTSSVRSRLDSAGWPRAMRLWELPSPIIPLPYWSDSEHLSSHGMIRTTLERLHVTALREHCATLDWTWLTSTRYETPSLTASEKSER